MNEVRRREERETRAIKYTHIKCTFLVNTRTHTHLHTAHNNLSALAPLSLELGLSSPQVPQNLGQGVVLPHFGLPQGRSGREGGKH